MKFLLAVLQLLEWKSAQYCGRTEYLAFIIVASSGPSGLAQYISLWCLTTINVVTITCGVDDCLVFELAELSVDLKAPIAIFRKVLNQRRILCVY